MSSYCDLYFSSCVLECDMMSLVCILPLSAFSTLQGVFMKPVDMSAADVIGMV